MPAVGDGRRGPDPRTRPQLSPPRPSGSTASTLAGGNDLRIGDDRASAAPLAARWPRRSSRRAAARQRRRRRHRRRDRAGASSATWTTKLRRLGGSAAGGLRSASSRGRDDDHRSWRRPSADRRQAARQSPAQATHRPDGRHRPSEFHVHDWSCPRRVSTSRKASGAPRPRGDGAVRAESVSAATAESPQSNRQEKSEAATQIAQFALARMPADWPLSTAARGETLASRGNHPGRVIESGSSSSSSLSGGSSFCSLTSWRIVLFSANACLASLAHVS